MSKEAGFGFVVVLGSTDYYSRFGFVPASDFGLDSEYRAGDHFWRWNSERTPWQESLVSSSISRSSKPTGADSRVNARHAGGRSILRAADAGRLVHLRRLPHLRLRVVQ